MKKVFSCKTEIIKLNISCNVYLKESTSDKTSVYLENIDDEDIKIRMNSDDHSMTIQYGKIFRSIKPIDDKKLSYIVIETSNLNGLSITDANVFVSNFENPNTITDLKMLSILSLYGKGSISLNLLTTENLKHFDLFMSNESKIHAKGFFFPDSHLCIKIKDSAHINTVTSLIDVLDLENHSNHKIDNFYVNKLDYNGSKNSVFRGEIDKEVRYKIYDEAEIDLIVNDNTIIHYDKSTSSQNKNVKLLKINKESSKEKLNTFFKEKQEGSGEVFLLKKILKKDFPTEHINEKNREHIIKALNFIDFKKEKLSEHQFNNLKLLSSIYIKNKKNKGMTYLF